MNTLQPIQRNKVRNVLYEKDNIVYCGKDKDLITKKYFRINDECFLQYEFTYKNKIIVREINYFSVYDSGITLRYVNHNFNLGKTYTKYLFDTSTDTKFRSVKKSFTCTKCIDHVIYSQVTTEISFDRLLFFNNPILTYKQIYDEQFKPIVSMKCNCGDKLRISEINEMRNGYRISKNYVNGKIIFKGISKTIEVVVNMIKGYDGSKLITNISKNKNSFDLNQNLFIKRNKIGQLTSIVKDNIELLKIKRYKGEIIKYYDYHGNYYNNKTFKNKCLLDGEDIFYNLVKIYD